MAKLDIVTLGDFRILIDSQPIPKMLSRKVELLLLYLAVEQHPHPREILSDLLWDDQPRDRALSYLRTALANLQKQCAPFLLVTRQTISLNPNSIYHVDFLTLQNALDTTENWLKDHTWLDSTRAAALEEGLKLYGGAFLKGIHVRGAANIDTWITTQNSHLHQRLLASYQALGEYALAQNIPQKGILWMQRALEIDPLHEFCQNLLIRFYLQGGQRAAALTQYERYRHNLAQELQVEPSAETTALYQTIRDKIFAVHASNPPRSTLPIPTTAFIPRPNDLDTVERLLGETACRLITLVGLGGVGKTRLAIEIARRALPEDYPDGIFYVSLPMLESPDQITAAMLHALKIPLQGTLSPEQEIFLYFQPKRSLVVLDNFEAFPENTLFLSRLVSHAIHAKFLATARERLNLEEEWVHGVQGLPFPQAHHPHAADYEAVQLFIQSARRHRPDIRYEYDMAHIVRICQAVEGIPLALELAAPWVRLLPVKKIADEIDHSIDFLTTSVRNVPQRHRSMRAIFDSSYALLSEAERTLFCRLAVFRNGFTQTAAEQVAQADLFTLLGLADKSLVQGADGRYSIHEILRQYAYEKLNQAKQVFDEVIDRHANYYAEFFEQNSRNLILNPDDPLYGIVMSESQNFTQAWERIRQRGDFLLMGQLLKPFFRLFDMQNRYAEGQRFFRQAVEDFQQAGKKIDPSILARAKILLALCSEVVNQYTESEQLARESLPIFLARNAAWDIQLAYRCLGRSAYARGSYVEAQQYFEQTRVIVEQLDDPSVHATVLLRLSDIAGVLGDYQRAKQLLEQSLQLLDTPAFNVARIRFLTTLADIQIKLGELDEAERHLLEAKRSCEFSDNRLGLTVVNSGLGRVYTVQGRLIEAVDHFRHSIDQCEELKHTWGRIFAQIHLGHVLILQHDIFNALQNLEAAVNAASAIRARWLLVMAFLYLGWAHLAQDDYGLAAENLYAALHESVPLNAIPATLDVLAGFAMLQAAQGQSEAGELAQFITAHPLCEYRTRLIVEPILRQFPPTAARPLSLPERIQELVDTG